ncbi:mRNA binding protein [Salix suchowensis]|nr:mRNA binding protein [Salix suchowensis]
MSMHNPSDTARKPSGSSNHSGVRSGSASTEVDTDCCEYVGCCYEWLVKRYESPEFRLAAASISELASSLGEGAYCSGMNENWTTSRSSSATWDDASASPQRKEYSNIDSLNLHHPRQRQANVTTAATFSGNGGGDRSATGSKSCQFTQYEVGLSKDTANQQQRHRDITSGSPPHSFPTVPYATTSSIQNGAGSGYEPLPRQSMSSAEDLAMAFRGMAVEDDGSRSSLRWRPLLCTVKQGPRKHDGDLHDNPTLQALNRIPKTVRDRLHDCWDERDAMVVGEGDGGGSESMDGGRERQTRKRGGTMKEERRGRWGRRQDRANTVQRLSSQDGPHISVSLGIFLGGGILLQQHPLFVETRCIKSTVWGRETAQKRAGNEGRQ